MTSKKNLNAAQISLCYVIIYAVDKKGTGQWTVDSGHLTGAVYSKYRTARTPYSTH